MRALKLLVSIAALAAGPLATAKELYELPWIEARSTNFIAHSLLSQEETVQILRNLEDFRQVVASFTTAGQLYDPIPTHLFLFTKVVPELGLTNVIRSVYMPHLRGNYAMARPTALAPFADVVQLGYTHVLLRNNNPQRYAIWYDTGMAELLSTIKFKDGRVILGEASRNRADWLRRGAWLPFSRVVDNDWSRRLFRTNTAEVAQYDAQAWALCHYLMLGRPGVDFTAQNARYAQLL